MKKKIAIIGGMGPQASAKLLEVIVGKCTSDFGIEIDSDFPEIVLDSVPVPNFISDRNNAKKALVILKKRVRLLSAFSPSCFGIACNTAHILLPELKKITNIPFVSIIDEVAKSVSENKIKKAGLLGTPTTIRSNLYQEALARHHIEAIVPPDKQVMINEVIIKGVLAGKTNKKDIDELIKIARSLERKGAEGIVLGCTELPLIFPKNFNLPIFDSVELLANGLLKKCFK